jgi:uncharacterized membrane protein
VTAIPATPLDAAALAVFLVAIAGFRLLAGLRPFRQRSIVHAAQAQRVAWMRNMALRDNRVLDTILLGGLGQGNAFFASTSAIAIGALAALMGSGERAQALIELIPFVARSSPALWEIKALLLMAIFIYAFFKFAWAFRLTHYCAIMIGATPLLGATNAAECERHAERTARLIGIAADHANSGLRSYYYAFAAMAWFFHPLALIAATLFVLAILIRRDFYSRSRALLAEPTPAGTVVSRPPRGEAAAHL